MARVFPRSVWLLVTIQFVASSVSIATKLPRAEGEIALILDTFAWGFLPTVLVVVGALIVARQPGNVVGWLLMVPAISGLVEALATAGLGGLDQAPAIATPRMVIALAFDNFSWVFLIFPILHLLLAFPTGRLLSRRWRPVVALEIAMVALMMILGFFVDRIGPIDGDWTIENPIGFIPGSAIEGLFNVAWGVGLMLVTISGVVAIFIRYRRAAVVERHQIKLLLFAVALFGVAYPTALQLDSGGGFVDFLLALSLAAIAIAIAIAVLKYRLFEIDRLVSRTVGYALVIGVLGLVYAAGAVWLPSVLSGDSPVFVALTTLAIAALFNPVRRRLLHAVDRRFYRARYDAEQVIEAFMARIRSQTDLDHLTNDWVSVVTSTMSPSVVGIWLRAR